MQEEKNENQIVIYQDERGVSLEVNIEKETVWLTQEQIAKLFNKGRSTITEHINNIFDEEELDNRTRRKFRQVQKEGNRVINREIEKYNLDVIISVGYRVKSKEGTKFRIWATNTLRQYLLQGFVLNQKKLEQENRKLLEFKETVEFITNKIGKSELVGKEKNLLNVIKNYTNSFKILNQYDEDDLEIGNLKEEQDFILTYEDTLNFISEMKDSLQRENQNVELFGKERNDTLKGIIGTIYQTFSGNTLYSSIEEKAAHLLYFVIKDHPFFDGNKRSGAGLFVYFLDRNNYLKSNGISKINEAGLVTLALLVAQSDPKEKETMIKLIINLIKESK